MDLVMWIVVGPVVMLACIALIPVLVVGTWFVVMTVILGLSDGIIWVLDRRWRNSHHERDSKTGLNFSLYKIL
jgi:uncharacterized membrane protein